ncbi:MAG TPA: protein-L-isoaspartate(D-aspartate) O-methyltransferase [Bryobacteraceae bacterium]|nr:protein-L-isoaspartate(D-aspartate) O-methyltransferase [Bryobacteraceae bacterium]
MRRSGVLCFSAALVLCAQDPYQAPRERMVREQMLARGIRNAAVLDVMRRTPRHLFMPPDVWTLAYADHPVPIGYGQTISQPYIVAFMTELLDVRKDQRVLEIGTGSGYQAAILAALAHEIYSVEIVAPLAVSAAERLKRLGYHNVFVRQGDGYQGWPEKAPFDRILLTAAPPDLPQAVVDQLKAGGKLLAPVGRSSADQEIRLIEKHTDGRISTRSVLPVSFVPMVKRPAQ